MDKEDPVSAMIARPLTLVTSLWLMANTFLSEVNESQQPQAGPYSGVTIPNSLNCVSAGSTSTVGVIGVAGMKPAEYSAPPPPGAGEPQWPDAPSWPTPVPAAGRTRGAEAVWAESTRDLLSRPETGVSAGIAPRHGGRRHPAVDGTDARDVEQDRRESETE